MKAATVGALALAAWSLLLVVVFPVRWLLLLLLGLWAVALTASYVGKMRQAPPQPQPPSAAANSTAAQDGEG